jgi:hypothetical protein
MTFESIGLTAHGGLLELVLSHALVGMTVRRRAGCGSQPIGDQVSWFDHVHTVAFGQVDRVRLHRATVIL